MCTVIIDKFIRVAITAAVCQRIFLEGHQNNDENPLSSGAVPIPIDKGGQRNSSLFHRCASNSKTAVQSTTTTRQTPSN